MTISAIARRTVLSGVFALGMLFAADARPASSSGDDMVLGHPTAPVTVIEYASVGCPHCAVWANAVFPAFRARYIDTGRVRFVFREMLTGQPTLAAAGFLTARCAGPAKYFEVVEQIFRSQEEMLREGDAYGPLLRIAGAAGVTKDRFDACMKDKAALVALQARSDRNSRANSIAGTPTFVVNGQRLVGEQSLEELAAAIATAGRH
ncbi:MAG TPA: DsbA family protein [Caulobacteraceae bacterium]